VALSLFFWMAGALGTTLGESALGSIFDYLAVQNHFTDFLFGLISTGNIVYFLSVTAGALFLATRVLEVRRWR
jgi:ABC-2 type transport system permease protein